MRNESYPVYAIVQGDTAQDLTEQLNDTLRQLKSDVIDVQFEGLIARVKYTEREGKRPESLADEYELHGFKLTCCMCPYFEPFRKADGTPDGRKKIGGCPLTSNGATYRDTPACPALFNAINNGEVELCFAK